MQVSLERRFTLSQERIEAEALRRTEALRSERKAGRVPERVSNSLRTCTVAQLFKAKKLCDRFIWDQRHAPSEDDCYKSFIVEVLLSIPHRNQRYRLELIRTSMRAEKVYVNGPYWYRYWRDGKVVFRRAVGKKNVRQLPRKVKSKLKEYLATHDPARVLVEAREKYRRAHRD